MLDADIISLHVPANKESFHLFDADMFSKVKKGAVLVNAARGAVIDTPELIKVLMTVHYMCAAIDTYEMKRHTLLMIGQVKRSKMKLIRIN